MYNNSIIIKGGNYMGNLKFIKDRIKEYNSKRAPKLLGALFEIINDNLYVLTNWHI